MFESIVSKITNIIRKAVCSVGATSNRAPWLAPAAILVFFLLV